MNNILNSYVDFMLVLKVKFTIKGNVTTILRFSDRKNLSNLLFLYSINQDNTYPYQDNKIFNVFLIDFLLVQNSKLKRISNFVYMLSCRTGEIY